ncbi:MAG TPA: DUF3302 domain-containing protein [Planctomicrobium sp.]|nr:DUF3302 domain-containing protein [Planctomicrobium sp.]
MLDVVTLLIIIVVVGINVAFLLWLAALPGQIAQERQHPQVDAIRVCGWLSLLTFFATWPVALIWAYTRPLHVAVQPGEEKAGTSR